MAEREDGGTAQLDTPSDEFAAEVSDTRAGVENLPASASVSGALLPLETRRTPRERALRQGGVVAAVMLALAVILSGIPGVRDRAIGLFTPAPTPTVALGDDLFYLLPNPPGVEVSLDGHLLANPPLPTGRHPLRLARGHHVFAWRSRVYPFVPLHCTVSVPHASGDSCPFVMPETAPTPGDFISGHVIGMHASLATLSTSDMVDLLAAITVALNGSASTTLLQPGERFFSLTDSGADSSTVATEPLRATLMYQFMAFSRSLGYPDPCVLGQPAIPCRSLGQDCAALCTLPVAPAVAGAPDAWIAAAMVRATWAYTTLDGGVVNANIAEVYGAQLATLRITHDSSGWHVVPIFGHTSGLPAADDAACDPARYWLGNSTWSFMLVDPPPGSQAQFISDGNPADGCLVDLDQAPGSGGSAAFFLEHCGLLLTLNANAYNPNDHFGSADAHEQQIARQLAALAHIQWWVRAVST